MPRFVVVGGGVGGIVTALRLRASGAEVVLLEKNRVLGGKLAWIEEDGYYFDLGPTLLTMPFVFEQLFEDLGVRLEDYLELIPVDPTCRYHWTDGTRFDAFAPASRFVAEVERVFPDDRDGAAAYLEDAHRMYEATKEIFLFGPFRRFSEFITHADAGLIRELPRLEPSRTLHQSVRRRLRSPKLIQLFDRFATYSGSSPFRVPASLKVISHVELGIGAWYPRGGMKSIVAALERLAVERGVVIRTSTEVTGLELSDGRVAALQIGYERVKADAVVSNIDVLWTWRHLLGPAGLSMPARVRNAERSCSGFLILAEVEGATSGLAHHNIFFSDNYREEFTEIFEKRSLAPEMTIYVSISSRSDSGLAPSGCENWYILVNAPSGGIEHGDRERQNRYAEEVWQRLEVFGVKPKRRRERILGPVDFESGSNSVGGALYGASSNSLFAPFRRPSNRVPGVANMYFVGGSTHPGGGVPMVALSARIVSTMLLDDHAKYQGERIDTRQAPSPARS